MKNEIIELSKKEKIDIIGFTDFSFDNILLEKYSLQEKLNYKCSFQVGDITDKTLTSEKYKIYKSAIVIGVSYPKINTEELHLSSCSWGMDYHTVLREKLGVIGNYLSQQKYIYEIFVDNNSLDERYLAYKAGLGFFGKNNMLINDKLGSYFFIGVLLTNAEFEYDQSINKNCSECNLCVKSCPTKALNDTGILNSKKCLSYLTQKSEVSEEESNNFNSCIYGCDICNDVCPYNKKVKSDNFQSLGNELIDEKKFLAMTNEEYKNVYSNNSCFWRKKKILDRNINYYIKNKSKN